MPAAAYSMKLASGVRSRWQWLRWSAMFGVSAMWRSHGVLVGGAKKDVLEGEADDDTILAKDGQRDSGSGGLGPDRGRFDANDAIASIADRQFQGGC